MSGLVRIVLQTKHVRKRLNIGNNDKELPKKLTGVTDLYIVRWTAAVKTAFSYICVRYI